MNPLEKIKELDERVTQLEQQAVPAEPKPKPERKHQRHRFTRPLLPEARELFLLAFHELRAQAQKKYDEAVDKNAAEIAAGRYTVPLPLVTASAVSEMVRSLDSHNTYPHHPNGDLNQTLRAILAEEAGMYIQWSKDPLLSKDYKDYPA